MAVCQKRFLVCSISIIPLTSSAFDFIYSGYGMTEIAGASHVTPSPSKGKTKFGSVGLLLPNMRCKVSLVRFYYY